MSASTGSIDRGSYDAVLFDLDGVLTATATVHAKCWKIMFDEFLRRRAERTGEPVQSFEIATDYKLHIDGKRRFDGVRSFLESRKIDLPEGRPDEPAGTDTIRGLGNRKNELVHELIESEGVDVYDGSVRFVHELRRAGIRTGVVSSSNNCRAVLEAAGIADLFEVQVDGKVATELKLPGKPAPDTFLKAAELLGVDPKRAVVVEDAISGVQAGRAGGFGLVVGVDREGHARELRESGADLVVEDLAELTVEGGETGRS
jgi:beta-phosphoglucomutase family hydrolase